jgi:DNA adenine methylase
MKMRNGIVKWPGSKVRLLESLLPKIPYTTRFHDPFAGAGSLPLAYMRGLEDPITLHINDANQHLACLWDCLRNHEMTTSLIHKIGQHLDLTRTDGEDYFNLVKSLDQTPDTIYLRPFEWLGGYQRVTVAARFYYLVRMAFNGIWRVNRAGYFNVPYARHKTETIRAVKDKTPDHLKEIHGVLSRNVVYVNSAGYQDAFTKVCAGDFVYIDPPYLDTFSMYTAKAFTEDDHLELAEYINGLDMLGAKIMISHQDHELYRALYAKWNIHVVEAYRSVSGKGDSRKKQHELIITNYEK